MSTPIYQLTVVKNNLAMWQAYHALSEEDGKAFFGKEEASRESHGVKQIIYCFSAWADEERPYWGLLRFPSLEARIQHTLDLQKMGWLENVDAFTLLGTSDSEPLEVTFPNPVYKLWVLKASPAGENFMSSMSQEEITSVTEQHNAILKEVGGIVMINCNSYWCNEAYPSFGINVYPSVEANMKMMQVQEELGWRRAVNSFTLLGIPSTGDE